MCLYSTMVDQLISEHSDVIETKFMYRLKSDEKSSTKKKELMTKSEKTASKNFYQ